MTWPGTRGALEPMPERAVSMGQQDVGDLLPKSMNCCVIGCMRNTRVDAVLQGRCIRITPETGPMFSTFRDIKSYQFADVRQHRFLLRSITDQLAIRADGDPWGGLQRLAELTAHIADQFPSPHCPASRGFLSNSARFFLGAGPRNG